MWSYLLLRKTSVTDLRKPEKALGTLEKHPPGVQIDMSSRAGTRTTERGLFIPNGSLRATNVDMPLFCFVFFKLLTVCKLCSRGQ